MLLTCSSVPSLSKGTQSASSLTLSSIKVLVSKLLLPTVLPEAPASLRTILEGSMRTGETAVPAANRTCRTRRVLLREASITFSLASLQHLLESVLADRKLALLQSLVEIKSSPLHSTRATRSASFRQIPTIRRTSRSAC